MSWIKERMQEASTWLGLSNVILGAGLLFKINEAPEIAKTVENAATPLANGDWSTAIMLVGSGILGVLFKDKAQK